MKRASKPNKKITTASQLLPVHGLLSNVFGFKTDSITGFFGSDFLNEYTPYGPLIHTLLYFRIREDIRQIMCINAVEDGVSTERDLQAV